MREDYRTLIYEPDASLGKDLMSRLGTSVGQSVWCTNNAEAIGLLEGAKVDVAVISPSPNGSGLDVLGYPAKASSKIPFLIVTPDDALQTRVLGLNSGAVDYLIYRIRIKARSWGLRIKAYRGMAYVLDKSFSHQANRDKTACHCC